MKVQKIAVDLSLPWGTTPIDISCNIRREAYPAIDADSSGGAFIAWPRQRYSGNPAGDQVMVQHINVNGTAQWTAGGVVLVDSVFVGGSDSAWSGYAIRPSVTADGMGSAVVAWNDWRVRARNSLSNETGWSFANYDFTDIETPTGVSFPSHGTSFISVLVNSSFSNLDEGQSGYIIYNLTQGTDSGWKQDTSSWLSDGLTPNTSYEFCARARNGYGRETPLSSSSYLRTSVAQPGAAAFSNVTTSSIQANWTANGNPARTEYLCENTVTGADSG